MTEKTIPNGYWEDANGALIPVSKIKDIDKDRHRTVTDLCQAAIKQNSELARFKAAAMAEVTDFIQRSLAEYDVKHGGKKGNVTLISFDGRFKVIRQMQEIQACRRDALTWVDRRAIGEAIARIAQIESKRHG